MSRNPLDLLHKVRTRREHSAQRELDARRKAESEPRNAVFNAQSALQGELVRRQVLASQWGVQASTTSSVADQMAGRVCLQRMDAEVIVRTEAVKRVEAVLEIAVKATEASALALVRARIAKEKNKHSAERYEYLRQRERTEVEESDLEDDTDVQVTTKFMQAKR